MQAKDIMTTKMVTINLGASVRHAIDLMIDNGVSGLPVVDDIDRLCGLVTEGDLLIRKEINPDGTRLEGTRATPRDLERYIQSKGWGVADVMSRNLITADPDAPIGQVANAMFTHHIKRVPIVTQGRLVGLIGRRDLLRVIANSARDVIASGDDAIRLAITSRLRSDLGLDSDHLTITVHNAYVSVAGDVNSELERKAIKVLVESVTGSNGFADKMHVTSHLS
ncbi:MAG: CBS domain-containing protein [Rhizobiaceae bacterium]|nr:CBS domain-containing protein [Rhizobiaceae bacterium]